MKAAGPLEGDVDAGLLLQRGRKPAQALDDRSVQAGIGRHAESLALHPDQREVAARGAEGAVALVEHGHALPAAQPQAIAAPTRPPPTTATS